jgi:halimadienyl-diphosphate synthase
MVFEANFFAPYSQEHLYQQIEELLEQVVVGLETGFGGSISAAAYDTAWVARIPHPYEEGQLAFPQALDWLLENQAADGSWSEPYPYTLLPTMAALLALKKAPVQTTRVCTAAQCAEDYLANKLASWEVDKHESVGFEVLAPGLLNELADLGLNFNFPDYPELMQLYHKKLTITNPEMLYRGDSSLIHSIEAFWSKLDYTRLKALQASDGSYGTSPAATAATLIYGHWDEKAYRWLEQLVIGGDGGVPTVYPFEIFESAWIVYNFAQAGYRFPPQLLQPILNYFEKSMTAKGVCYTATLGVPVNADDTSMVLGLLALFGRSQDTSVLMHFEREKHFACYTTERNPSLSSNAHSLETLLYCQQANSKAVDKLVTFLLSQRNSEGYWYDKWHASPYYVTSCSFLALAAHPNPQVRQHLAVTENWLLKNQHPDGGWGREKSTAEETAYALGLLKATRNPQYDLVIRRGKKWLANNQTILPMWIGKQLYAPKRVVQSAILAALL